MSEHIKIGFVVFDVSHPVGKLWVDVEWLKEQLKGQIVTDSPTAEGWNYAIKRVLSLLSSQEENVEMYKL